MDKDFEQFYQSSVPYSLRQFSNGTLTVSEKEDGRRQGLVNRLNVLTEPSHDISQDSIVSSQ